MNYFPKYLKMSQFFLLIFGILLLIIGIFLRQNKKSNLQQVEEKKVQPKISKEKTKPLLDASNQSTTQKPSLKELLKKEAATKKMLSQKKRTNPTHPKFFKAFKGFSEGIVDFDLDNDGNILVAASLDKTIRVFKCNGIDDQNPATTLQKIDLNNPVAISLSHDCKTVAVVLDAENSVKVYNISGIGKYEDEDSKIKIDLTTSFPKGLHKTTIHSLYLDKSAKFLITSSEENDTNVRVWSIFGDILNTFNNTQLKNYKMCATQDGNFVGIASWGPDVRIFEIKRNKDGTFKSFTKAMELKGHRQSIYNLGFNDVSDRAITFSKDNTLKIWNINVSYQLSEDPKCLQTIDITKNPDLNGKFFDQIAIYFNAQEKINIIALAYGSDIILYDLTQDKIVENINNAHNEGHKITKLLFRFISNQLYLFSSGEDGRINMWKI